MRWATVPSWTRRFFAPARFELISRSRLRNAGRRGEDHSLRHLTHLSSCRVPICSRRSDAGREVEAFTGIIAGKSGWWLGGLQGGSCAIDLGCEQLLDSVRAVERGRRRHAGRRRGFRGPGMRRSQRSREPIASGGPRRPDNEVMLTRGLDGCLGGKAARCRPAGAPRRSHVKAEQNEAWGGTRDAMPSSRLHHGAEGSAGVEGSSAANARGGVRARSMRVATSLPELATATPLSSARQAVGGQRPSVSASAPFGTDLHRGC